MKDHVIEGSQRSYARFAGLMYILVLLLDIAGGVIVSSVGGNGTFAEASQRIIASETLYRVGLGVALVGSLSTILLAVSLYATLKPVDGNLTMMALLFRSAESAIGAVGIVIAFAVLQIQLAVNHAGAFDANQLGALANFSPATVTGVNAIFFSSGSTVFFYVFLKSGYIPRPLSAWGIFASLVYLGVWFTDLIVPNHPGLVTILGSLPILVAEVGTALWLLIAGIRIPVSLDPPVAFESMPTHSSNIAAGR
jgi:Domain of unknown function (DUF4386)